MPGALEEAEGLYIEGKCKEAKPLFQMAAKEGNPRAMYFMSQYGMFQQGNSWFYNQEAKDWLLRGIEKGDPFCGITYMLHSEEEREDLSSKAPIWKEELEHNVEDPVSCQVLADFYLSSAHGQDKDAIQKGYDLLRRSAEMGYWKSLEDLGIFYDDLGKGPNDFAKANMYYEQVASMGISDGIYRMAFLYYYGKGMKPNKEKGLYLWKKAAAKGHAGAAMTVGFLYSFSTQKKLLQEGFRYTKQAADWGIPTAIGNLANCYYYGKGTRKDKRLAKEWYEKASDLGLATSTMQLGVIYHEEGKDKKAFALFQKSANQGYAEAMGWLAACYHNGYGVEKDESAAHEWLKKAAGLGSKEAQVALQNFFA